VAPEDVFSGTVRGTARGTDDSAKPIDCVELTDEQVAKWMTDNVQDAASKVLRLYGSNAVRSEGLMNGRSAKRLNGREDQKQERVSEVFSLEAKPKTAEAIPSAIKSNPKQPGRKRDVLTADEFAAKKDADGIEEWKAEIAARPACPKCGVKHLGDCKGEPYRKK
jgi:hypothetical protein